MDSTHYFDRGEPATTVHGGHLLELLAARLGCPAVASRDAWARLPAAPPLVPRSPGRADTLAIPRREGEGAARARAEPAARPRPRRWWLALLAFVWSGLGDRATTRGYQGHAELRHGRPAR